MIAAGIDIGTNTVRLLVARLEPKRGLVPLYAEQRTVRLGEGLEGVGRLGEEAIGRTVGTLKEFSSRLSRWRIEPGEVIAVATSAVRDAENPQQFIDAVSRATGLQIEVITAREEARRTLLGICWSLPEITEEILALDIGGGSTEFIWGGPEGIRATACTGLGVVRLCEGYLGGYPIPEERMRAAMGRIRDAMSTAVASLSDQAGCSRFPGVLVGTAGTLTTLAAMEQGLRIYDSSKVHRQRLGRSAVERWARCFAERSPSERLAFPGLEKGREDLILPGTLILLNAMQTLGYPEVLVSDFGLREGILLDRYQKSSPNPG